MSELLDGARERIVNFQDAVRHDDGGWYESGFLAGATYAIEHVAERMGSLTMMPHADARQTLTAWIEELEDARGIYRDRKAKEPE